MFSPAGFVLCGIFLLVMCLHIWFANKWKNSDDIVMTSKEMRNVHRDKIEMVRKTYMMGHVMACFVDVFLCVAFLLGSDIVMIIGIIAYFAVFAPSCYVGTKYSHNSRHFM